MSACDATTNPEPPLLHICHAPVDHGWVRGRMLPALGLTAGQYRTREEDGLGELQVAEIARAVEDCRYTVLIASRAARWDRWVQLAAALAQHVSIEQQAPRLFIIVLDAVPGAATALGRLPLLQRALVSLDCTNEQRAEQSLAHLRRLLGLIEPVSRPPACPYPGLEHFTAANRHLMFGRDRDRDALLHRIRACHRRILVVGPSGSGKSSLIHAAVLPALPPEQYLVQVVPRGGDLVAALHAAIDGLGIPGAPAAFSEYLVALRGAGNLERQHAIAHLRHALAAEVPRRIVVIDPLEEIFADDDMARREMLFDLLRGLWNLSGCTVILCMRADFYGALMSERCWSELEHHQYAVAPLDEAGLRAAVVDPAAHVDVHVEPALVERLVREIDHDRASVPLPLLQVALKELWERLSWRYLTLENYERIVSQDQRGLAAALAVHADGVIGALPEPGDSEMAQRILLDLVHLGEGRPHTRRRRTIDQLRRSGDPPGQLGRVLRGLIDGRLVVTGNGDRAASRYVDLAHDILISGWGALATWVQDRQADLRKHRRFEGWVREWLDSSRAGRLLDEIATTEARAWCDSPGGRALGVSDTLVELISASEAEHARLRHEKEQLMACLANERRRTQDGVGLAVQVAHRIAFRVDVDLQEITGASRVRETLLEQADRLLTNLPEIPDLDARSRPVGLAVKAAQADVAVARGQLDIAYRLLRELGEHGKRLERAPTYPRSGIAGPVLPVRVDANGGGQGEIDDEERWIQDRLAVYASLLDGDQVNAAWRDELATRFCELGDVALARGRLDDARTWFETSVAIYQTLASAEPISSIWPRRLAACCDKLRDAAVAAGSVGDALHWLDKAVTTRASLREAKEQHCKALTDRCVSPCGDPVEQHAMDPDGGRQAPVTAPTAQRSPEKMAVGRPVIRSRRQRSHKP